MKLIVAALLLASASALNLRGDRSLTGTGGDCKSLAAVQACATITCAGDGKANVKFESSCFKAGKVSFFAGFPAGGTCTKDETTGTFLFSEVTCGSTVTLYAKDGQFESGSIIAVNDECEDLVPTNRNALDQTCGPYEIVVKCPDATTCASDLGACADGVDRKDCKCVPKYKPQDHVCGTAAPCKKAGVCDGKTSTCGAGAADTNPALCDDVDPLCVSRSCSPGGDCVYAGVAGSCSGGGVATCKSKSCVGATTQTKKCTEVNDYSGQACAFQAAVNLGQVNPPCSVPKTCQNGVCKDCKACA